MLKGLSAYASSVSLLLIIFFQADTALAVVSFRKTSFLLAVFRTACLSFLVGYIFAILGDVYKVQSVFGSIYDYRCSENPVLQVDMVFC